MVTIDPADVSTDPNKAYFDKESLKKLKYGSSEWETRVQQQIVSKKKSCTLYVGNLSFQTTEEQIFELFSVAGEVKQVIMGLDKVNYTPCGFCFVEFHKREDAESCMRFINGTKLDERVIRTDWDAGFIEGRQFGRGRSGGQVRDEYRSDFDPDRGGFGHSADSFPIMFKEMVSAASRLGSPPGISVPPLTESGAMEEKEEKEEKGEKGEKEEKEEKEEKMEEKGENMEEKGENMEEKGENMEKEEKGEKMEEKGEKEEKEEKMEEKMEEKGEKEEKEEMEEKATEEPAKEEKMDTD